MHIIIDGYNLLKQRYPGMYVEDTVRDQFARVLGAYQKRRGHHIVLIYDGGIDPWPILQTKAGIKVIYAGFGRTADDYIKYYIAEHHQEDLLLVSSDRELDHWASKYSIASMDSLSFYDIISDRTAHEHKQKPGAAIKTTTTEDTDLDALMEGASAHIGLKEQDRLAQTTRSRSTGHKESKIERLLRKKVDKL